MANVKITDLTALSGGDVASNDVLPIVDINVDQTKKIAIADLITATSAANDFITFTQLNANLNVLDANADAIEARRVANVTVMTNEDTALQSRLTTNVNIFTAEDVRINANVDVVQDNVAATEARRVANVTIMNDEDTALQSRLATNVTAFTNEDTALQSRLATNVTAFTNEDTALQSRLATNVTAFTNEDTALQARIAANTLVAASNDFITFTRLNANINVVQDNVAGLTSTLTIRGDNASDDTVTLGSETLTFVGDDGLTTSVSSNTVTIDLDDTAVTAGLYGGVIGAVSNVPAITIDAQGRITNAANVEIAVDLSTLEGNVNTVSSNTDAVEARRVANIAGAISTVLTSDLTASRAMVTNGSGKIAVSDVTSTELGYLDGVSSAIQTQLNSKIATTDSASNDFVTFTRLDSNINVVSSNSAAVEARRVANIAGAVSTITTSDLTASRAMVTNGSGKVDVSAVTATELGYLDGVSSALQTQLDAKAALAGATFTGQVNMSDDLVVTGNLTVNGDTTTANSVNLLVQDRMIMLANSATGSPSADVGILFNRGDEGNAAIFYDESATTFKLSDTKDPSSNTSLSPVTSSNLDVGILTATTVKQNGANLDDLISSNVDGAISTVNDTDLTASRALVSSGSGKIEVSAVTATEVGYLDGVSSAIQTQLDAKSTTSNAAALAAEDVALQARITANNTATTAVETRRAANIAGAVSTITTSDLTASRALVSSGSGKVAISDVTATELGYLDGVSSAIQTQLNSKIATTDSASNDFITYTQLNANINVVSSNSAAVEARRVANIAGAVSTVTTSDLTASRALVSGSGGKIEVSAITSTELGHLDGIDQNINSNLAALAAGIAASSAGDFPTGDYGLLDSANSSTDSFGVAIAGLTTFDMKTDPSGSLATEDLGALT